MMMMKKKVLKKTTPTPTTIDPTRRWPGNCVAC
jgi:hypothetical protein